MAGTHAKAVRRADVLQRLSDRLGIDQADLYTNARGDDEMALIITLERIADAVEDKVGAADKKQAPATIKEAVQRVEGDLEAETGKDFAKVADTPPTLAETDKPTDSKSKRK